MKRKHQTTSPAQPWAMPWAKPRPAFAAAPSLPAILVLLGVVLPVSIQIILPC